MNLVAVVIAAEYLLTREHLLVDRVVERVLNRPLLRDYLNFALI